MQRSDKALETGEEIAQEVSPQECGEAEKEAKNEAIEDPAGVEPDTALIDAAGGADGDADQVNISALETAKVEMEDDDDECW